MQKVKTGFTLIELLVVVLIIGVLTTIALPQYQKAVEKARFTTYRSLADGLAKAAKNYYLTNGEWPTKFDGLEITLPADMKFIRCSDQTCAYANDKMFCSIIEFRENYCSGGIVCGDIDTHLIYGTNYKNSKTGEIVDERNCFAKNGEVNYQAVCKSISGGATPGSTYAPQPTGGWNGGYLYYRID